MRRPLGLAILAFVPSSVLLCSAGAMASQVGVWNFDNSLTNAVGGKSPLSVIGAWTPAYESQTIGGSPATVLSFPKFDPTQAIGMTNDASGNGPIRGASTNNWSIAMDINFPAVVSWTSLWDTGTLGASDGDFFINNNRAIGVGNYTGAFPENTWTRLVVTVDAAVDPTKYTVKGYLDGVLTSTSTTDLPPGGREGIKDVLHLFSDDDSETSSGLVSSLAYYGQTLNDAAVASLGAATAAGIPANAGQAGRWEFNDNLNNAIGGKAPLAAVGEWTPTYQTVDIGGSSAKALSFMGFDDTQSLDMLNEAARDAPAVSSAKTNVWSVVMDVKFPALSGYTSLFSTDFTANADGEYFIRKSATVPTEGGIGISGDYQGTFTADTWTRLTVTVDGSVEGEYKLSGYINGVIVGEAVTSGTVPDGRFAIDDLLQLFKDEDNETSAGYVNSIAYYDELLTPAAITALGSATASGIPVTAPVTDADFDNNGIVDGKDFLVWQRGFGINSGATNAQGDADQNGKVDSADLAVWKGHYGLASAAPAAGAIPEPGSLVLAAFAASLLASRGLRKQSR